MLALEPVTKTSKKLCINGCGRRYFHKSKLCYWCRRTALFNSGLVKLNNGQPYSKKTFNDMRNHKLCSYPNCNALIPSGASTRYCIPHRVEKKERR